VKKAMHEAFDRLAAMDDHAPNIIGPFEMMGVNALADSAVVIRFRIKTLPGKQWAIGRAYNEIVKEIFDERGIEIPFPHLTLYAGEDKKGQAPAFRVLSKRERPSAPAPHAESTALEATGEVTGDPVSQAPKSPPEQAAITEAALSDLATDIPEESGKRKHQD